MRHLMQKVIPNVELMYCNFAALCSDVKVMGSWNQWKEGIPMQFDNNRKVWNAVVNLPPGQHHVRFVMDNNKVWCHLAMPHHLRRMSLTTISL